jgi:GTPase SAR1 family protein
LNKWIDNVREVRGEEALIMICGNKCDLDAERCVDNALATSKINELGLTYMEVSAKTGHNIKEFFRELSYVVAGGKKSKEEPTPKQPTSSNPPSGQANKPASGTVDLNKAGKNSSEERKSKKC